MDADGTGYGNTLFHVSGIFAHDRSLNFASNKFGESNAAAVNIRSCT